jgi:putative DNA primase/helicase
MSVQLEQFMVLLDGAKRTSDGGIMGRCPVHADDTASLHLNDGDRGVTIHCFGCNAGAEAICAKLGIEVADLFFTPRNGSTSSRPQANGRNGHAWRAPDATYQLRDEAGELIATKYRIDGQDGGKKRMWLTRDGHKGLGGMPVTSLPLYRAEDAAQWPDDSSVVFVEGEKCTDRLRNSQIKALGSACGAAVIPEDGRLRVMVRFAEIIMFPDNDEPGRKHARRVGERLLALGLSRDKLRWLEPSRVEGLKAEGADAADLDDDQLRDALDGAIVPFPRESTEASEADEDIRPPEFSDDALAIEFADHHAEDLRYVATETQWREYDGVRWRGDTTLRAFSLARLNNRRIAARAAEALNAKDAVKVCSALTSGKTIAATVSLARSDRRLASRIEDWDRDPFLLNTPLGVVDLKIGQLRAHRPDDYMTKLTGAGPAQGSDCPLWREFLDRIFAGDTDLIAFLQRALGYSLTGSVAEQMLFFLYGMGANGKSVLGNVARAAFGDYGVSIPMDALTITQFQQHPTELTDLKSARFASAIETDSGRRWAEARIKALTGGDKIKARRMRQDFFEFDPTHKLWISGNHRPRLNVDYAIKRRFALIPFEVVIPKAEQDQKLAEKIIAAELPAVLSWMIEGALYWQMDGLAPPQKVLDATEEYLTSQDSLAGWIDDRCIADVNQFAETKDLFADWKLYAEQAHEYIGTERGLVTRLAERGFKRGHNPCRTARGLHGIGLKNPPQPKLPSPGEGRN